MEVIDLGVNDLEPLSINFNDSEPKSSVSFGSGIPGIELLMNDKKKASGTSSRIDLGDLGKFENDLNELSESSNVHTSQSSSGSSTKTLSGFASSLFGFGSQPEPAVENVSVSKTYESDSRLGEATVDSIGNTKTWDGFSKASEVPINDISMSSKLPEREKRRKKRIMIKKLEEWRDKGLIKSNSHFDMDSNYDEVEDEYESAIEDKRKRDAIKLQGDWFVTFVNSIEYANTVFNPFDLNLDGLGEKISDEIDSYEEIFGELHEKYKGGKLSPELNLLLRFGFAVSLVNFTNKALSTATPGFNDVIRQSPDLMREFTRATVESMKSQNPSFSFAENILNPNMGPPPAPVKTRDQPPPPPTARPGMQFTQAPSSRPDINASRGTMFRESGIELNKQYDNVNRQERSNITEAPTSRPEMQGPRNTDIDNILAGLKPKTSLVNEEPQMNFTPQNTSSINMEDDSMISISSLKDMQNTLMPKRSNRRKNRSDKNVISLDI